MHADKGANDCGEHTALGEEHAAACGLGMRHAFERKDEENGSDQISSFHEVGREGHFASGLASDLRLLNIFSMRSVMPNPPTTLMVAAVTAMKPRMCANLGYCGSPASTREPMSDIPE